jgi:hypothetical protein
VHPGAAIAFIVSSALTLSLQVAQSTVTGTWTGMLTFKGDAQRQEEYVHAVLKQDGAVVTGTAGPDADRQFRILKGKATAAKDVTTLTFEVIVDNVLTSFDLKLADGLLKGTATSEGEDGVRHVGTAGLKPVK